MGPPHVQEVPAVTTTPQAVRRASPRTRRPATPVAPDPTTGLLPQAEPVRLLDPDGTPLPPRADLPAPPVETLREMYRRMVVGRRFDAQSTALTKQGRLAVYPSSRGQEACQVGAVLALRDDDWVFPTYRESMALTARGIDPVEVLTLLRGDWHCGYDPTVVRTAPQCTPLATQCVHAAGLAYGESYQGRDTVALAFIGDGATSEGDFHEGLNFAAVFKAPVVYFVQNNKYAISVPLSRQTAAPSLAYKGVGYGVPSEQVDGNDPVAVLAVLTRAVAHARAGHGPYLVEAHTYRMEAHTNADDASRYRDPDEVEAWRDRDPVARLEAYLRSRGELDDAAVAQVAAEAEAYAADLRERMHAQPVVDPLSLFEHVYAEPTPQLVEQREMVRAELAADAEGDA
ncbi:pyruvate dehydrogenase (acetyl-transferring) E1 component subunit alpha [Micromonospora sp. SCSIO 07396]|uniref:Pyruvate dehydrogenase (Acetyl-transferring) E1 component subunit alpha n=1 Tax=Micromonospora humidisoli TaxID=2807622 RepID=A0ABS2JHD5_9ACTN|nr:pyruvate dehydrogenase (acetyl-transferring) E1 component subunit alpha [Micromonospora humidisoli]MBM7085450.1 pyruvate dehydrogenase (acetyl-transferring) E1 component subunit alpha [Micromonospora humidisoli]